MEKVDKTSTMVLLPGQMYVSGMIRSVDKFQLKNKEIRYRNRILMKNTADKDYGYPMPVDIVSESPIGKVREIYEGAVVVSTYPADYTTRPDDNGEVRKIKKVELTCYLPD